MRNELAQTFSDKQKVLSEAHGTDAGMLCTDSDTVGSDYVALQSSDGPDSGDLPSITAAIEQLKQDNASLDASRASDPASVPTGAPTDTQVSAAINAAQAKIDQRFGTGSVDAEHREGICQQG
jgi:hypothetical protein